MTPYSFANSQQGRMKLIHFLASVYCELGPIIAPYSPLQYPSKNQTRSDTGNHLNSIKWGSHMRCPYWLGVREFSRCPAPQQVCWMGRLKERWPSVCLHYFRAQAGLASLRSNSCSHSLAGRHMANTIQINPIQRNQIL